MPGALDLVFAGVIAVVYPLWDHFVSWPRMLKTIRSGVPDARVKVYRETIALEWLGAAVIAALWLRGHRAWSALWLVAPSGWRLALGVALFALLAWLMGKQMAAVPGKIAALTPERLQKARAKYEALSPIVPHTPKERAWFWSTSLTAGFCEELVYRGFLVWALRPQLGLFGAAAASAICFGFAHAYQGPRLAIGTAVTGALFGALAIATGSIVPGMFIHALVDVVNGETLYPVFREPRAA
jgi:membrane protease YdiL (CAAX protease family)